MLVQRITEPAAEPVTLAEVKAQLNLEHELDNPLLEVMLAAARAWVEEHCWRGVVSQGWKVVEACFADHPELPLERQGIELPKGNLVTVESVKYVDGDGVEQTLVENADYVVDTMSVPGRVRLAYGKSWPSHRSQWDAVRIEYTVGWEVAAVPAPIKQAVLLLVSQLYEQRTPEVTGTIVAAVGFSLTALLQPYRLVRFS